MLPQDPSSYPPPSGPPPQQPAPGWVPPPGPGGAGGPYDPGAGWAPPGPWVGPTQKRRRFGWLAITMAFLIGGFVSFLVCVGLIVAIGMNYEPSTTPHPAAAEGATVPKVGDCLLPSPKRADVTSDQDIVDCKEHHGSEVAAVFEVPGGATIPGHQDLAGYADDACTIAFEGYVGTSVDDSIYGYRPVIPSAASWSDGDTRVWCLVDAGGIGGTVRNSHD